MAVETLNQTPDLKQEQNPGLTVDKAVNLLFYSFQYSQNYKALQREMIRYLHLTNPTWKISPEDFNNILGGLKEKTARYVGHAEAGNRTYHTRVAQTQLETECEKAVNAMTTIFDSELEDKDSTIDNVLSGVILEDFNYVANRTRPRTNVDPNSPKGDPYFSYIVYHVIQGHDAAMPEYTRMFGDMREKMQQGLDPEQSEAFGAMIGEYNKHHEQQVELPR